MPGTTGSMANPRFLSQLPLAQIIANNDQQSRDSIAARVLPGNYRLLNQASQRCLSYSSRPAPHAPVTTTKAPEIVTGWSCGVPGVDDDLHQIWTVRLTPTKLNDHSKVPSLDPKVQSPAPQTQPPPTGTSGIGPVKPARALPMGPILPGPVQSSNSVKRFKNSVILESLDFSTSAGAGHPFRLDFVNVMAAIDQVTPSGRDTIPNGPKPPVTPVFTVMDTPTASVAAQPTTPLPPLPSVGSYLRELWVSPQGAATSSFQILCTDTTNKFLIFNPATGMFIGHTPTVQVPSPAQPSQPTPTGISGISPQSISIPLEQALDGSAVEAADLHQYLQDVETYLRTRKGVGTNDILAKIRMELGFWVWELSREDFGVGKESCRLVHDQTLRALTKQTPSSSGVVPAPIDPFSTSQIWDLTPLPNPVKATITYSVISHADATPLLPKTTSPQRLFRLIYVPETQPLSGMAASTPSPSPVAPSSYLIYDVEAASFLGIRFSHNSGLKSSDGKAGDLTEFSLNSSPNSPMFRGIDLNPSVPFESNQLLSRMFQDVDKFRVDFGWLIWRILPNAWAPADGIYTIQSTLSPTYMDIPATNFLSPCPIPLVSAYTFPSIGSSFWRIKSNVDSNSGTIYQTVINYRSGHLIDNSGGTLVGRRLGDSKDEKWRFLGPTANSDAFALMDYSTMNQGIVVNTSGGGNLATFGPSTDTQFLWKVEKVDLGIIDGSYYIRDLTSRQYLSRNSDKKQQEPLLLTLQPTSWAVTSVPGSSLKRISASADPNCFLYCPSAASNWSNSTDEVFAITNYDQNALASDTSSQFGLDVDASTGEVSIFAKSLSRTMTVSVSTDEEDTLVVCFKPENEARKEWEFIPSIPANRNWTAPSWLAQNKIPIPNLPDGVYRLSNGQTKTCLVLAAIDGDQKLGAKRVGVTGSLKEAATEQLWYIKRDRNPSISLQTYTITSLKHLLVLRERSLNIGQPLEGLKLWAEPAETNIPSVLATQKWMLWKISALGWCLQSCGGSGGLLEIGEDNQPCTKPQLESTPTVTQVWQLNRAPPELSGGYYSIQNLFTQSFVSVKGSAPVTSSYGLYGKAASDWRVTALPNGLFRIQAMATLQYLCSDTTGPEGKPVVALLSNIAVDELSACWNLLPSAKGLLVQNARTRTNLTTPHGSANDGIVQELLPGGSTKKGPIAWQVFAFDRVDSPCLAFNDLTSDMVTGGQYAITNVGTQTHLGWPAGKVSLGTPVVCNRPASATADLWTISQSGTGYYTFTLSSFPLGLSPATPGQMGSLPIAGVSGLDSSMWKLLKFDTGNYRIINKDNGLMLMQDSQGNVTQGPDDDIPSLLNEWKLDLDSKTSTKAQSMAKSPDRELQPTNGLYLFSNSSTSSVISLAGPTAQPISAARDLEPYSTNARCQIWIVQQTRENYYIIKSFPFGLSLACSAESTPRLTVGTNDKSHSYQWKFIQDSATNTLRCVPRDRPDLVVAPDTSSNLTLAAYCGSAIQRWQIIRSTGTPTDTKLAQGTYIISRYVAPPDPFALQSQAASIQKATVTDDKYIQNLELIAKAATTLSASLINGFPPAALPAGVDTAGVEAQLEGADLRDAHPIMRIVSWFYGNLYAASKSVPKADAASPKADAASPPVPDTTPARPTPVDTALSEIGDLLVAFCNISTPSTAPAAVANKINGIALQTKLLATTTASDIQTGILNAGESFLDKLNTYIQTLPGPASLNTDPAAPLSITQVEGTVATVTMSPLASQALSQFWLVEAAGNDSFTISHLTSKRYLGYDRTTAAPGQPGKVTLQGTPASTWKISIERLGGYSIVSTTDANMAMCSLNSVSNVNCETYLPDGQLGYAQQRWVLRRQGYYLQNQAQNNLHRVAAKDTGSNGVHLTAFRPFGQNTLLNGIRSDAYTIWHLVKIDSGKYRIYNECSRTALRNAGSNLITATDSSQTDADLWQLAKNGDDMWMQSQDVKKWMSLDSASGTTLCVQDPGDKEKWKGWQLISITTVERGLLTSLPRNILVPRVPAGNDQSLVVSLDAANPINIASQQQYMADNSYQRFRSYTYAKNTLYFNEATARVIKANGSTTDISGVEDQSAWFTSDAAQNISCLDTSQIPVFSATISNTGDLSSSNPSLRIQIGNTGTMSSLPRVLSVDSNGNLISALWDRLSDSQVWSFLDWDRGRFVIHVQTSRMLAISDSNVILLPAGSHSQAAMWKMDMSNSSQAGVQGFFPLRPAYTQTAMSLSLTDNGSIALSSQANFGCRFIRDSSWFYFTDRLTMLTTFIKTRMPVFVHAKGVVLPISVDAYLHNSTVVDKSSPSSQPISAASSFPPAGQGDWVLTYTGAVSDRSNATAYIVVRDATEPIYINYTDFIIYLLYPSTTNSVGGWQHITMRFNNYSNLLESVYFPSLGWIYNLDMNYSTLASPEKNPLKVIKRQNNTTKLHVYVGADSVPVPKFPNDPTNQSIIDGSQWELSLDSGAEASRVLVRADMIKDDEIGSRPVPPPWTRYGGAWVSGNVANAVAPQAKFNIYD